MTVCSLRLLDCFCGMGGVSDGFALEGFDVTGIDIVDAPKLLGYKHKFIQADILTLKGEDFRGYDVIWGSPPCRDFTQLPSQSTTKKGIFREWKIPKSAEKGVKLVVAFRQFIIDAEPTFWILENVKGLRTHLSLPRFCTYLGYNRRYRCFWGNFPPFLMSKTNVSLQQSFNSKVRSWERAKIPLPCGKAFAQACKEKLQP